ncbi:uncharacterized protein LOC129338472 [Eublepharis macularius]|uniref:Uncharacterized protein LOC129338472 n=1 Tax=Eublepharis macularius TaxID=481883 RepID=A0AA97LA71_EUBMA|nr:uncharacterized protein LOC129338472 [Eublepharis macularius]
MDNGTKQMVAHWIGRFLAIHRCQKSSPQEWIQNNWKRFLHFTSYSDLLNSWGASNGSAFLTEAEGSALEYMTPSQVAEITVALGVLSNISLTKVVAQALASKDVHFAEDFLSKLAPLLPQPPPVHNKASLHLMLESILQKVGQSFPDLCSPSLKDLFQRKLRVFLPAADEKILKLFPTRIGCTDFHDIYKGINSVYHELDPVTQKAVYKSRMDFLERQLAKEGVACTFSTSNSKEWLQENFGLSSIFVAYDDFVRLNPSFNGVSNLIRILSEHSLNQLSLHMWG